MTKGECIHLCVHIEIKNRPKINYPHTLAVKRHWGISELLL